MMKLFKDKKGTIPDKIYAVYVFALVVVVVVSFGFAWTITQPIIRGLGGSYNEAAMDLLEPTAVNQWLDWAIVLVYFGISLVVCIILPLFVENNPVLFGIFAFVMMIMIFANALLSNALVEFLQSFAPSYILTIFLLENFVVLEVVFMLIMMFMLFFKGRSQSSVYS